MTTSQDRQHNWPAIHDDYRAARLSVREVARLHGITEGAIRKKAKQEGWSRDLGEAVQQRARRDLVRTSVRTVNAEGASRTEDEIVDRAAATVVQVVRGHRRDIAKGVAMIDLLMHQLQEVMRDRDAIEAIIDTETADDRTVERRSRLMRAVSIPANAATLRDLSTAMKNFIGLERQAFNIKVDDEPATDTLKTFLDQIAERGSRLPIRLHGSATGSP